VTSSYRTYVVGHSIVGVPLFSHIKTPFCAGGVTALNPDAKDIFIEEIKGDQYLSSDGTWKDIQVMREVIKVRLGFDVTLDIKYTENGVLMPKDIFHKETKPFHEHLVRGLWESDDIWNEGKQYALAQYFDPIMHDSLGGTEGVWPLFGESMRFQATRNEDVKDPVRFIKKHRETTKIPFNFIYILEIGDIVYWQGGGALPARLNNVAGGVYPKIGKNPANKWQGRIPYDDYPYLINPKSGYIVSCNNHMASANVKHGTSHAMTFTGRKSRVTEIIEELFAKTGNKVHERQIQQMATDVLDVQARASLNDMLYCVDKATLNLSDA